jgi:hypothetical protein
MIWSLKYCPDCREVIPGQEFHKCKSRRSGLQVYCKKHQLDRVRKRNAGKAELIRALIEIKAGQEHLRLAVLSFARFTEAANMAIFLGRPGPLNTALKEDIHDTILPLIQYENWIEYRCENRGVGQRRTEK